MKEALLYVLLEKPIEGATVGQLPEAVMRETIGRSLWSAEEKARLYAHRAYAEWLFSLEPDPIEAFLQAYQAIVALPKVVGIANPVAQTAHTIEWTQKIFADGLVATARETPPLHLWTGLVPVQVEPSLSDLLAERTHTLWLRTAGYEQFGLPNLAHPLADLRETGWIHSLFEMLFDWMYFERRILQPGEAIEVPERGRYLIEAFVPGVLALTEWHDAA